jgi:hypothetical protein
MRILSCFVFDDTSVRMWVFFGGRNYIVGGGRYCPMSNSGYICELWVHSILKTFSQWNQICRLRITTKGEAAQRSVVSSIENRNLSLETGA